MSRSEYINEWYVSPERWEFFTAGGSNDPMTRDYGNPSIRTLKLARLALVVGLLLLTSHVPKRSARPAPALRREGRSTSATMRTSRRSAIAETRIRLRTDTIRT